MPALAAGTLATTATYAATTNPTAPQNYALVTGANWP